MIPDYPERPYRPAPGKRIVRHVTTNGGKIYISHRYDTGHIWVIVQDERMIHATRINRLGQVDSHHRFKRPGGSGRTLPPGAPQGGRA